MSTLGKRKAALYLASLAQCDRNVLLKGVPASIKNELCRMIENIPVDVRADNDLITEILGKDLVGLTIDTSHSIEQLLKLAEFLEPVWLARIFTANSSMDAKFLLALLDQKKADKVSRHIRDVPFLPSSLKSALLIEASNILNERFETLQ
jgi:hypothetical protein